MITDRVTVSDQRIAGFCRRWKIARLSLFGSVLREDFDDESDIDVLVAFRDDAEWSLWDWIELSEELQKLFGRDVDVVEESGLRNPFRRHEIMNTRQVVYDN